MAHPDTLAQRVHLSQMWIGKILANLHTQASEVRRLPLPDLGHGRHNLSQDKSPLAEMVPAHFPDGHVQDRGLH
jgi:hypothetical protein